MKIANLSVCIITKDECNKLERCLKSLQGYGFEIIVVDTGSADDTIQMAQSYTQQVYEYAWCDDFAAAKNYAAEKATNDYILSMDSDEYLVPLTDQQFAQLQQQIEQHPGQVGRIYCINEIERDGEERENYEWISRLYSKKDYFYKGRIHEQLTAYKKGNADTFQSVITIRHDGYKGTAEEKKRKAMRNIRLLERELEAEENPYLLYQLGKAYYMAGDPLRAAEYFDRGLYYELDPRLEYVIDMVETYGYALINSGQEKKALGLEGVYEEFGVYADFQFLMGLIYMKNAMFPEAVEEFEKATSQRQCRMQGVNSYLAYHNIGVILECLGMEEDAQGYYHKERESRREALSQRRKE